MQSIIISRSNCVLNSVGAFRSTQILQSVRDCAKQLTFPHERNTCGVNKWIQESPAQPFRLGLHDVRNYNVNFRFAWYKNRWSCSIGSHITSTAQTKKCSVPKVVRDSEILGKSCDSEKNILLRRSHRKVLNT
jgi:hypothetical protein